jgi:aryl-alcohol dehydrogenase-like predicted oxidoreductase
MRYTLLGNSGLRVSEVALGTMTFGTDWGWGAPAGESAKQFELFAEAGGTLIDTANKYTNGTAESILGDLLATDRDHFALAPSTRSTSATATSTPAATTARAWCRHLRHRCSGCVPTTSTSCGCTPGTT